jgi:hypothetical protein
VNAAAVVARIELAQRVQPAVAVGRLRIWALEAEGSLLEGDAVDALGRLSMLRREAPNLGSDQPKLRQLLDLAVGNCESWARYGDMDAAVSALDDVRAVLGDLELELEPESESEPEAAAG